MQLIKPVFKCTLLATALAASGMALQAQAQEQHPEAVQQLIDRGVTVAGSFEAPNNMTGYVGDMQGRPIAFYLTSDDQHVIVGTMLNAQGENLTEAKIQELVTGPQNEKAWSQIENAD
ncbi:disulfide isomerase DsbC N-terminal domain-containing protein [Marinobacter salexigens]|uniref:disulfide isomerase DsbC N-terminal domain-containing protein n=1 Tax=Marinobacter salexigens TaxID=1925763 RepID=UPI002090CA72|nr:hypothetical protein [Marinobacter salexigens]